MSGSERMFVQSLLRACGGRYPRENEAHIAQEVASFLVEAPTISCMVDTYPQPAANGVRPILLVLHGTVPIVFNQSTYHIPIKIWLTEYYPDYKPLVFVTPTSTMQVKSGHPHVDPTGFVTMPYVHGWSARESSLSGMFKELVEQFSRIPPVYARQSVRPSNGPTTNSAPTGLYDSQTSMQDMNNNFTGSAFPYSSDPGAQKREALQNDVQRKLQFYFGEMRKEHEATLEENSQEIEQLNAEISSLQSQSSSAQRICIKREQEVVVLRKEKENLEKFVAENSADDPDSTLGVFQDVQARQIMQSIADDLGLQDALHTLEEALEAHIIDLPVFLTEVRRLSREQYRARALIRKIRLMQVQATAPPGGARS
ncbi:Tumor susceptibility protein [Porphyridium purpureum]|uniref:Tumor susceptibility protein n=1 Tax=Porphyridium purpureum TaxID=35688 RepID=A0A5J4Z4V1_PORPP|nr:Tumor susceptibility protein [Porphyridium purpureum]|eukprot:POR1139..scf295_1